MADTGDALPSMADRVYSPDLSPEHVARLRRWHEEALRAAREEAGTDGQTFDYLGLTLHVPPEVQPITGMSHLLGESVIAEVRPGDRVLDMGTGCGVNAILAARAGAEVLAVDVNPRAVEAARANVNVNSVANRVEVQHSDVFNRISAEERQFDVVIFDPPFRWFQPRDLLETATADPGYRALTTFVHEVRDYLSTFGRVLVFFGSSGDLAFLQRLVTERGFSSEVLARKTLTKDGWQVEYVTYRLRPVAPDLWAFRPGQKPTPMRARPSRRVVQDARMSPVSTAADSKEYGALHVEACQQRFAVRGLALTHPIRPGH